MSSGDRVTVRPFSPPNTAFQIVVLNAEVCPTGLPMAMVNGMANDAAASFSCWYLRPPWEINHNCRVPIYVRSTLYPAVRRRLPLSQWSWMLKSSVRTCRRVCCGRNQHASHG